MEDRGMSVEMDIDNDLAVAIKAVNNINTCVANGVDPEKYYRESQTIPHLRLVTTGTSYHVELVGFSLDEDDISHMRYYDDDSEELQPVEEFLLSCMYDAIAELKAAIDNTK